jgi:hypothetical protein
LHSGELHGSYSSPDIIKIKNSEEDGHDVLMGEMRDIQNFSEKRKS